MALPAGDRAERIRFEFWRAATLTVPVGTGVGIALFVLFTAIADSSYSHSDPSPAFVISLASALLLGAAIVSGAIKRGPRVRGVATGLLAAALLVGLAGLMLR